MSRALRAGIVGLPNAGKSTLFNALTASGVPAEAYPFTTIDPNVGVVEVPDPRLDRLFELLKPPRKVPATVEFFDIAGLVEGAHKGEGLGNRFLSHIREVEALVSPNHYANPLIAGREGETAFGAAQLRSPVSAAVAARTSPEGP